MSTIVLERPRDTTTIVARRLLKRTDADVYAEIARAWYRMRPSSDHLEHPIKKYVVAPSFARQVWDQPGIDPHAVIDVCARVVSEDDWRLREQTRQTVVCSHLEDGLDPVNGWWHPLGSIGEVTVGLHFWRLAIGTIELRSVGPADEAPQLQAPPVAKNR
jgi:hypothetical protein